MSESSLSKKFKAFTGFRFREYLIYVRTHAAADLLVNTSLSITEIADKCGFADSNTMGGTFKNHGRSARKLQKEPLIIFFILEWRLLWQILFYLMKISLIFLLVNFLMIRIIRQWVSIILSIILDIMVNGMTRYATTLITVRGFLDYF